nr:UvrD-helicase domain-containing protein [Azospirillum soli]
MIDEYQGIDEDQYNLVSAIAGRQEKEPEARIALLAVGDNDQSVYRFRGANVGFIRRFREDYGAQVYYLVESYRSTAAIIAATGAVIAANAERMKPNHPIRIDGARAGQPDGGRWAALDPVGRGRVRRLAVDDAAHQLGATLAEVRRLRTLAPETAWSEVAVLARTRHDLMPKRYRTDTAEEWRDRVQVTTWEIPVLEVWTDAAGWHRSGTACELVNRSFNADQVASPVPSGDRSPYKHPLNKTRFICP